MASCGTYGTALQNTPPVARQGRPKLTPENRHADHEAQALVEVVASTNGREQLAPCTGVLPNTSVDLPPHSDAV